MHAITKQLTVLMGAGASCPFLGSKRVRLTTGEISRQFLLNRPWRVAWQRFQNQRRSLSPHSRNALDIDAAIRLRDLAARCLGRSRSFSTGSFECVIHLLDRTSAVLQAHGADEIAQIDALLPVLLDRTRFSRWKKTHAGTSDPSGWSLLSPLAREVIIDIILHGWSAAGAARRRSAIGLIQGFFNQLEQECGRIAVYSLNYDPILSESLIPRLYRTGFLGTGNFSSTAFLSDPRHTLGFLHGHASLVPDPPHIRFEQDPYKASETRIRQAVHPNGANRRGAKGVHSNTCMITGLDKSDAFAAEPFSTYLKGFVRDISMSECILVIGTSLADDHLATFLLHTTMIDPRQKVVIVDRVAPDDLFVAGTSVPTKRIMKLLSILGARVPMDPKYWRAFSQDIRKKGYGQLARGVAFFSRGADEFFKLPTTADVFAAAGSR